MSGQKIILALTATLSENLEYLLWLTRLEDIQFESELMSIISFPLKYSVKKVFNSSSLRFKHQLEFTSLLLTHTLPLHTRQGSINYWKMQKLPWMNSSSGGDAWWYTQRSSDKIQLHYSCQGTTSLSIPLQSFNLNLRPRHGLSVLTFHGSLSFQYPAQNGVLH